MEAKGPQTLPQNSLTTKISSTTSHYGHALARIAATQILESANFENSYRRPIDALADLMLRYISHVGKLSLSYANMAGRTNSNVIDVILALEEIASFQGFTAQSDPNQTFSSSGVLLDISRFVGTVKEVPFAGSVIRFPVTRITRVQTLQHVGVVVQSHVPNWLPPFPHPETYINRSHSNESSVPSRKKERPHFTFGKFFSLNGSDRFAPVGPTSLERENEAVQKNPFLMSPLPHGERQVSDTIIPSERQRISVIETFAPIIEGSGEEIIEERGASSNKRPALQFRIGVGMRSVSKLLSLRDTGGKEDSWTVKEEETDSKKRRAEMILKESMEKPNELAQL